MTRSEDEHLAELKEKPTFTDARRKQAKVLGVYYAN